MLKFLTSLGILYAFSIAVLLLYGWFYYKQFVKNGQLKKSFPIVFGLVSLACFAFLYFNIHASLALKTFSNLDHHFIRHDGFRVAGSMELGRTDTVHFRNQAYNRFLLSKEQNLLKVSSSYAEEPFYTSAGEGYKIVSVNFPAQGHSISFQCDSILVSLHTSSDSLFELRINETHVYKASKQIRKGISCRNIFKDEISFINSDYYTHEGLSSALKSILLLRDGKAGINATSVSYFLSGRLFQFAGNIKYDQRTIQQDNLAFNATLADKAIIAWGLGFPDNNKNQFRIHYLSADSFALMNRYPVSYPMTEEKNKEGSGEDWSRHNVSKFLVSDPTNLQNMPAVFGEGFLFAPFRGDSTLDFSPVLLSYLKDRANKPLQLQARFLDKGSGQLKQPGAPDQLILPARSAAFAWVFSIQNSFNWNFGKRVLSPKAWQFLLFGTLLFFFIMVFGSAILKRGNALSWIWQILTTVTMVLLTTRFFLYWRYKSFPPYEGLDLPSQQQLNSPWNFGIIIFSGIILAFIFGNGLLKWLFATARKKTAILFKRSYGNRMHKESLLTEEKITEAISRSRIVKKISLRVVFLLSWLFILLAGGSLATLSHFDPSTCRHLAIGLTLVYFLFIYISYRYSPLVAPAEKCWWRIHTGRPGDIILNNPVKLLLSVSLLGLFIFVDMGFAIVFLNFLLFNEAFLCINYAIAGLSAGSKKNAALFGFCGFAYLLVFGINLIAGPYIFRYLLSLPQFVYGVAYFLFSCMIGWIIVRLLYSMPNVKRILTGVLSAGFLFALAILFFPKERILKKAGMTRYRIDVMAMPVDKAIENAYREGKTYEPVIRAAQNQWFINTFIYEKNNPAVNTSGFHLLPHAPQNKGARYNAQATDLVASRFLIAEHGRWSVLLYVLLLLLPATLLASFYKLYPDFTNRINHHYPAITAGFSLLNYLLIMALLVIMAATGRYIFFGQDLPFGSILSKQSILFPSILIVAIVMLFRKTPLEYYPNSRKMIPGIIVFTGLALMLFLVKPVYNRNKDFNVANLAKEMDTYIEMRLQPVLDYFDTSRATRKQSMGMKDKLFTDSVRQWLAAGYINDAGKFLGKEIELYTRNGFSAHLDQSRLLYLDLYSGKPRLAVNENYFHVEPPPHLQQYWSGHIFSDSSQFNITVWNSRDGSLIKKQISSFTSEPSVWADQDLQFVFRKKPGENSYDQLCLVNHSAGQFKLRQSGGETLLKTLDTFQLRNPDRIRITDGTGTDKLLVIEPEAFMKNYYVNGSRYYVYPLGADFIWARNFAETISSSWSANGNNKKNAFISLDKEMTDSLSSFIQVMMNRDTAYKKGAEYGICMADGNGRLLVMADFIKSFDRPDPNDKAGFNKMIRGDNGFISQSLLRKEIGNINLLRMNPGPGSTLKPIVFTSIASQMNIDWDLFSAEGFSEKQKFFGGEKVTEYDFEKNNGRIAGVVDYLRHSDNYYHSNLLLLGSYPRQNLQNILTGHFVTTRPQPDLSNGRAETNILWPFFNYKGKQYWLDGFEKWPGYKDGRVQFGSDSSFVSVGLNNNFGINTRRVANTFEIFSSVYDSLLFPVGYKKSGFILPEYALFDQQGTGMDNSRPNEVFMSSFRGHVKGSSQVMIPPVKMLDAFGKLVTQNRNYALTLDPYATEKAIDPFYVGNGVSYNGYQNLVREKVFEGMKQALFSGTASRLGALLKNGSPYYYYAKTGTTGDDDSKSKSKLFVVIISRKDITDPDFNFRKNKFYTIYFTSQNGPVKQNEEFQAKVIKFVEQSAAFKKYMEE